MTHRGNGPVAHKWQFQARFKATIGRQMVVKPPDAGDQKKTPIPKSHLKSAFDVVEVRRLELLTPYMRSKTSTKSEKTKKPRNSGKRQ